MATAIHFRDAVSLAGQFPLLAGVTFDVSEGEIVLLRGPNGAGKTSLLRACAGLLPISGGEAVVLGHDLCGDITALRREVGLFAHTSFLYEELTIEENLRFVIHAARLPKERVEVAITRLGLGGRLRSEVIAKLSTGQRRRAALSVLVARQPRLWLLDEPHAGLDEEGRGVVDELVSEAQGVGATILFASHETDRAARLANKIVDIDGGYAIAHGRAFETVPSKERPLAKIDELVSQVGIDVA